MIRIITFLATGGYAGLLPRIPGTWGSLVGVILYLALRSLPPQTTIVTTVVFIFLAAWIAGSAQKIYGGDDPGVIVIDEIAGFLVTMALQPFAWRSLVIGFVLFRLLDIWKPFPARTIERRIAGGWGIVLDDVVAGVYANLLLWGLRCVWPL